MIRLALLTLLAFAVPACWFIEGEDDIDDPDIDSQPQCMNQVCVTPDRPVRFDTIPRFGVGTEVSVKMQIHTSVRNSVDIFPSDPGIEVVRESGGLILRARKAGSFTLIARNVAGQAELARASFITADVASIGFTVRMEPIAPEPLTSVALLAGASDSIGVAFRDLGGEELAGRAPLAIDDPAIVSVTSPAPWFVVDGPYERTRFEVRGGKRGTAVATVTMLDGRTATLPIEVVDAPATLDLALVEYTRTGRLAAITGPVAVDDLIYASVVAKTSDGRFVAGAFASWQGTGPVKLHPATGYATTPDVQFQPIAPGTIGIVADVRGTPVTTTVDVH